MIAIAAHRRSTALTLALAALLAWPWSSFDAPGQAGPISQRGGRSASLGRGTGDDSVAYSPSMAARGLDDDDGDNEEIPGVPSGWTTECGDPVATVAPDLISWCSTGWGFPPKPLQRSLPRRC